LREHQRPAEDYHRAGAVTGYRALLHRALAQATGDERLARLACQLAGEQVVYDVLRQVPEVALVPEPDLLDAARLHVRPHLVRQAETRHADAAALSRLRDDAGGSGDADRRRGDDALELGVRLHERLHLLRRLGVVVVAVSDLDERHPLV